MRSKELPKQHPESQVKGLTCGLCQWFMTGYKNQTCRNVRGVEVNSPACIKYSEIKEDPYHDMNDDEYLCDIRSELKNGRFTFDPNPPLNELRALSESISISGKQYGTLQDLEALDQTLRRVVTSRSRVSSIYTYAIDIEQDLAEITKTIKVWLASKYPSYSAAKNETIRTAAFYRAVPELITIEANVDKLRITAKYVDDKLSSVEFTIRAIFSSSEKLWFSRNK